MEISAKKPPFKAEFLHKANRRGTGVASAPRRFKKLLLFGDDVKFKVGVYAFSVFKNFKVQVVAVLNFRFL